MAFVDHVAISLPTLRPDAVELDLVEKLETQLDRHGSGNREKESYYAGTNLVRQLGIAIPPQLESLTTVVGWPGTAVDALEERLDLYGWSDALGGDLDLADVFDANHLDVESSLIHLDALIFGTSFAVVGSGDDGEPSPLVTVHSPMSMTAEVDGRTRRVSSALSMLTEPGPSGADVVSEVTLYLPNETVRFGRAGMGRSGWTVLDRDRHSLGRVPVVQFANRPRANRRGGRSEITRAVRYLTDHAARTLIAMEVNREFYSAPQRYAVGLSEDAFEGADGQSISGWQTVMGRVWAIDANEDGELPQIGQFPASSPAPYLEQVRGLAQLLAAEAAVPASQLGFQTDNPASADAILRSEARLVKRTERRQTGYGRSWIEVGHLALMIRDGVPVSELPTLIPQWRDAATPTRSASADEASKLVGSGILPADSSITWDRVGLSPNEQRQLASEQQRMAGSQVLEMLMRSDDGGDEV